MAYRYGRVYPPMADAMGFSLKPPKWLRKLQPGKVLKKIAIPLAVIGGAILIPGAGGLIVHGLEAAGGAALSAIKSVPGLVSKGVNALTSPGEENAQGQAGPSLLQQVASAGGMLSPPVGTPPIIQAPSGSSIINPAKPLAAGAPGELPSWALPAGIAALALFALSGNQTRPARRMRRTRRSR